MQKRFMSLVVMETEVKTEMRYRFPPTRMARIFKTGQ